MSKTSKPRIGEPTTASAAPSARPSRPRPRLASFGELLWDVFPDGRRLLGGAPANLAFHARAAGAEALLLSRVGDDELGHEARRQLGEAGLELDFVGLDPHHATGRVDVSWRAGAPHYAIGADAAWDHIEIGTHDFEAQGPWDAFCFGSLAARSAVSRESLRSAWRALGTRGQAPLFVFDLNLRPPFVDWDFVREALDQSDLVKLNDEELAATEQAMGVSDGVAWLLSRDRVGMVCLTRGEQGASLFMAGTRLDQAAFPAHGGDPIGAGDAFLGQLVVGLLRGQAPELALRSAAQRAAWVASQAGAMPSGYEPQ